MKNGNKSWLQLYVDATLERDPYKRLALVRELTEMYRGKESKDRLGGIVEERSFRRSPKKEERKKRERHRKFRSGA
jgi:hypothetical protein